MRGKVFHKRIDLYPIRITPAYAGKSLTNGLYCAEHQDHPRLCGEKKTQVMRNVAAPGSPPPMRGKAEHVPRPQKSQGITPAYAGKSDDLSTVVKNSGGITPAYAGKSVDGISHIYGVRDHPRLCGEKARVR